MRVTSSMYYDSIYGSNNSKLSQKLFDVNKQIASGIKIQYASDDVTAFAETMKLDNEMVTLNQVKSSTESAYKVSNQTDIVLNEFDDGMNRMRTLLLQAANASSSESSRDAIADELRGLEEHLKNLANTSINGQFLFSGSAVDTRPISDDGTYMGNDKSMNALIGSNVKQTYNLPGSELFLGEEVRINREITSNVAQYDLSSTYGDFSGSTTAGSPSHITTDSTVRDLMGDTDGVKDNLDKHHFYLRGVKSDGSAFNKQIDMADEDKISELLNSIGDAYGNTPNLKLVNVSLNSSGQIIVEDKMRGSSKLDFHMVGAVDYNYAIGNDLADINDGSYANAGHIGNLDAGETNFAEIMNPTGAPNSLFVKEFIKSPYQSSAADVTNIDGLLYDRTEFSKSGSTVSSSISQIIKDGNAFASASTKISEVADLSQGTAGTLDGTQFKLSGKDVDGNPYDVQISFTSAGSTFSYDSNNNGTYDAGPFDIFDMSTPRVAVDADKMTYQQLMDVVNMAVTNTFPAGNTDANYDQAITDSKLRGEIFLSDDGKMTFGEVNSSNTKATISFHDVNSGDFSADSSVLSFNANNALTVRDAKTDFFAAIDNIITSVEEYKEYPDASSGGERIIGIQNAVQMVDDLLDHVGRSHSVVGAQSNTLTKALERTEILKLSTETLRSSVIDTDLAKASLELTQLTLNYEAMLSTVGRVSKLSLVNYL